MGCYLQTLSRHPETGFGEIDGSSPRSRLLARVVYGGNFRFARHSGLISFHKNDEGEL